MDRNSRSASDYRVIRNVTVVGSVVDGLLALGKLTGGMVAQSQALIADGIHSVVMGGADNLDKGEGSIIVGGVQNLNLGSFSSVLGQFEQVQTSSYHSLQT